MVAVRGIATVRQLQLSYDPARGAGRWSSPQHPASTTGELTTMSEVALASNLKDMFLSMASAPDDIDGPYREHAAGR